VSGACGRREPQVFESASVSSREPSAPGGGPRRGLKRRAPAFALIALVLVSACRQDMHNQPKYKGLRASVFFADGSSARPLVEGTIARGTLQTDEAFFTGKNGNTLVTELPFPVDEQVLDRGEQRFNIYCTPCHGLSGEGDGMIVRRGYRQPPSFHLDRLQKVPIGHFYDVMTNGFGAMPDYRAQVAPRDRWAIAAYVRALQLSQHTPAAELSQEERQRLSQPAAAAAPGEHK
jgi:mono/diheme cytochrome c family protein